MSDTLGRDQIAVFFLGGGINFSTMFQGSLYSDCTNLSLEKLQYADLGC